MPTQRFSIDAGRRPADDKSQLGVDVNDVPDVAKVVGLSLPKSFFALVLNKSFLTCVLYSFCSISMVIVNKLILTKYQFQFPMVLLFYQNLSSIFLLHVAKSFDALEFDKLNYQKALHWLPLNMFFVLMLLSGFYSLNLLSVPMVTIFKNSNNMIISFGDWFIYNQHVSNGTLGTMLLMVCAAVMAGMNDLEYNLWGYVWMTANCLSSAAFVLYMKKAMSTTNLNAFGKVYYNNLLSLPLIIVGDVLVFGDFKRFLVEDNLSFLNDPGFLLLFAFSGCIGFLLSMSSFICVQTTSPTTYSMIGSLNKIPLSILGIILFGSVITFKGGIYICISLVAGVIYAYTKAMEHRASKISNSNEKASGSPAGCKV